MKEENIVQKLKQLQESYQRMPYGPARLAANMEAVALADQAQSPYDRISTRYDLAWVCALGDDPAKALPVCAEFFALMDEYPGAFGARTKVEPPSAAMIALYVAMSLPQIPLDQCRALLEQFRQQVKRYGVGERVLRMHASNFYMETGDMEQAREHYKAFCRAKRDACSDCPACEAGNAAEFLLRDGRRAEAEQVLRPVLEGNLVCEDQPQAILAMLIHDDLNHGDLESAKDKAGRLARIACRDRSDLGHVGALLRCQAFTDPERSVTLLEKGLGWSIGMWDQRLLFRFYLGTWVFFVKLAEKRPSVQLTLPEKFPLYREQGLYDCAALADWFHGQAAAIGARFDSRNGSDWFARDLALAGAALD